MKGAYFFIDKDLTIRYSDLCADINKANEIYRYCYVKDYYSVFKNIILSLIIDKPIILLDVDLSESEIQHLTNNEYNKKEKYSIPKLDFNNIDEILQIIKKAATWRLNLFTSGTTGKPKIVAHSFKSLTRNVKISEKHSKDVWGFAYNPTHMAGIQVFFQALLNLNPIIRLFQLESNEILHRIRKYNITHISATSTYYKLLIPDESPLSNVNQITFGGEKLDSNTRNKLKNIFPNARILNIYASTEAGTLFSSKDDTFTVRENLKDRIKIKNNELYIHAELLGESDSINLSDEWFATGDIVETISANPLKIKFLHRIGEVINVGGYNINPHEVEEVLLSYPGIIDAFVFAKKNRITGNIILAEIISEKKDIIMVDLYKYLRMHLQEVKIPRIINIVSEIRKTNTGKKKRS